MKRFKKTVLSLLTLFLTTSLCFGQFLGDITSVSLSNQEEGKLATYTIVSLGADDMGSGNSEVTTGQLTYVVFPATADVNAVNSGSITIGAVTTPLTNFSAYGTNVLIFNMPVDLPAGLGFTMVLNNVHNPDFNVLCGTSVNTYASASPCDDFIQIYMMNVLNDQSLTNVYHHYQVPRFDILPTSYFISDVRAEKPNLSNVIENSIEQEMVRVKVTVSGSLGVLPQLNSVEFTSATTQPSHVVEAQLWYSQDGPIFHGDNDVLLGATINLNAPLNFGTNLTLSKGINYLWLSYDIACFYGLVGNNIDGALNSLTIDNQTYAPATPSGTRTIAQDLTISSSNLVPNPGFETFSSCPSSTSQINRADFWDALPITSANYLPSTPDFYHRCAPMNTAASVPNTGFGLQEPRTGDGFAGILTRGFGDWKEYLQVQLSTPLEAGKTYAINYFVSGGDRDFSSNFNANVRHDGLGFFLSVNQATAPYSIYGVPPTLNPQYISSAVIEDYVDWVPVSGTYTAQGGEEWLVIGCFLNNVDLTITPGGEDFGYYFVDDVSVILLDNIASSACQQIETAINTTPETCPGANDGTADILVYGGTPPFTTAWSDNGSGLIRNNLAPGIYNITITDNNSVTFQDLVYINAATPLAVEMTVVDASSTSTSDGLIQTLMTNGVGPYTYLWSTGATTANLNNLLHGAYTLTVTDATGCSNTFPVFVGVQAACTGNFSNFPYLYDTEKSLGLFMQNTDDDTNWRSRNVPTPTANTGPSVPFSGSYFRYIESSGSGSPGKTAVLTTKKCLNITGLNVPVFGFYYNLNGADMGELFVQLSADGGSTWSGPVWSTSGDQGDQWQRALIYLYEYSSTQLRIRLVGRTGGGGLSDLAIDSYYIGEDTGSFREGLTLPPVLAEAEQSQSDILTNELLVYPNPSNGAVTLNWQQQVPAAVTIRILDQMGRAVLQKEIVAEIGLQSQSLDLKVPSGMYFVELLQAHERLHQTLIILP